VRAEAGSRGISPRIPWLIGFFILLASFALALGAPKALAVSNHCVWHNSSGAPPCGFAGISTSVGDTPSHSWNIAGAEFDDATSGTSKSIARYSVCCTMEFYSSNIQNWHQTMPGRSTDAIVYYNNQQSPINATAYWTSNP